MHTRSAGLSKKKRNPNCLLFVRVLFAIPSGMYQTLHEDISVVGIFSRGTFVPKKFKWRQRELKITEVTLTSNTKDGGVKFIWFSVVAEDKNVYRLLFNRENYQWWVEEVWIEG